MAAAAWPRWTCCSSSCTLKPTTLVAMDIRQAVEEKHGNFFDDGDSKILRQIAGPATIIRREHFVTPAAQQRGLKTAKVYLLTSKKTVLGGRASVAVA